jgi:hypothetical protein
MEEKKSCEFDILKSEFDDQLIRLNTNACSIRSKVFLIKNLSQPTDTGEGPISEPVGILDQLILQVKTIKVQNIILEEALSALEKFVG